jgi:phage/plasmid-associated DNA primase
MNGQRRNASVGVFTGTGANGKTVLMSLMKNIFGSLFSPEPLGLMTSDKITPRNPELLTLRGKRMVVVNEPEREKAISSLIKMLEGDSLCVRDNYARAEEFIEFRPTFGLFILCNDAPKFSGDGGIRRRIRGVPFLMKYVDTPTQDNERVADPLIKEKFQNDILYRHAGFELLRRQYIKFRESGYIIETPPRVLETSTEVIDSGNPLLEWFESRFIKTSNNDDKIPKNDLYEIYRTSVMNPMSQIKFSRHIGDLGIEVYASNGTRYWRKITRRDQAEPNDCEITE